MALTAVEKARIRRHLGYLNVSLGAAINLGVLSANQPEFIVERTMNHILPEAEQLVRDDLSRCDAVESQLDTARTRFKADEVGSIKLNREEIDQLEREYDRWTGRLADDLGAPRNPMSYRQGGTAGGGINIPVQVMN